LDELPRLDAPAGDEPRLHIPVPAHELPDRGRVEALEDECRTVRRIAQGSSHDDATVVALGDDPGEVSLPVRASALGHVLDVVVQQQVLVLRTGHRA
jgi:hypothetical protein